MPGELLAPHYLHWLLDGFVLTLILSLLTCVMATGLGFLLCLARISLRACGRGRHGLTWPCFAIRRSATRRP